MNIAVCDDELNEREKIVDLIDVMLPECEVFQFDAGEALLQSCHNFSIIFLDIHMRGVNGMETAKKLRLLQNQAEIIFVTGLDQYVLQAFDVRAFHYLMKPIEKEKFCCVLRDAIKICREKAVNAQQKKNFSILVKTQISCIRVWVNEILYAEVNNRKVVLHTTRGNIEYYANLTDLEQELGSGFFRSHRAHLVNMDYILSYNSSSIILENEQEVWLSKKKYEEFVKAYLHYMKRMRSNDK